MRERERASSVFLFFLCSSENDIHYERERETHAEVRGPRLSEMLEVGENVDSW